MSDTINLKRAVFGVSKKGITQYIEKVSKDVDDKLLMKEREITSLKSDKEKLSLEIIELRDKLKLMEAEKDKISEAFVKAQEGAQRIISDAKKEAESLLAITREDVNNQLAELNREKEEKLNEMNAEISKQKDILKSYKDEIELLRDSVNKVLPKFDDILKKYTD